jgi:UDPglucose--hexose-1-phosphate uridylyltransferase
MPELRKDPVTGHWVIIRTERPHRPEEFRPPAPPIATAAPCALCEGHEQATPPELLAYRASGDGRANGPGWRVRVVPNKFPTLRVEGELERRGQGLYDLMNGVGAHELVVESPRHGDTLRVLAPAALEDVAHAFQERIIDLRRDTRFRSVVVFKPSRPTALSHPHSQLLATPTVPADLRLELLSARSYVDYRERCLFCDMLQQECDDKTRVVAESEHVVALVPFAARTPFETWLLPRRHLASYEHVTAGERRDLARVLGTVLQRIHALVGDAPVGFVLHSAPFGEGDVSFFHWHLELVPSVAIPDFQPEGSGFSVNPLPPEDAARYLRSTQDFVLGRG